MKTDFLHPTNRGGQIRTLETLRRLHERHEVHYIAFDDPSLPEGPERAGEYSSRHFKVPHLAPEKKLTSPAFVSQLLAGLISSLPVAVNRWRSQLMRREIEKLEAQYRYDAVVCDFLFPAPNVPNLSKAILFQHNVEAQIWRRHAEHAANPLKRAYFHLQANRMFAYEGEVCRKVRRVIAVSEGDARQMREWYGAREVHPVDTGVDTEFFARPGAAQTAADADAPELVFLGSMDWMPNIDGMQWFVREVLPLIHAERPRTRLAIVGRKPGPEILALAGDRVHVTGTVADVRPWLWQGKLSLVPLRIGGGTRLKIYESMAAGIPVVSTAVGAEGLEVHDGRNIAIADTPALFARRCLDLLDAPEARQAMASYALSIVKEKYSWHSVTTQFERLLGE